ncbi:GntR family transcriptional regulator [Azospirillum brasilense]|uniref:GntR family transcriptional regulator n=1 Tax=Azospirillum brasilense TaxID=192 RepID=A0A560CLJ6_AZOBR|nr:FadR/GntR family transcriptional regulator [Azospirillum brasilense]TWA85687.1 GntR family transcriptional regulator [Azospirillum brasilense]
MDDPEFDVSRHLQKIKVRRPPDIIIEQISDLIARRIIKAGQKLPAERVLAERFDVSRGTVREALRRLEFFGIVRTSPQSGTVVENLSEHVLLGLINNILNADDTSPEMLIEVRGALEALSARLATERAHGGQIDEIRKAQRRMREQAEANAYTLEEDLLFHLKVAEATNNNLLRSLIALMGPDVLRFSHQHATYKDGRMHAAANEHDAIIEAIERRQPEEAERLMKQHIDKSYEHYRRNGSAYDHPENDGARSDKPARTRRAKGAKSLREPE